ncbi:MAG: Fic family protein [Actinomycetota bacterium]
MPPEDLTIDTDIQALLSRADLALGRLDGVVELIPDPDRFVLMYVRREAVLSSQIEGTHASLMDVLEYEASADGAEARVDVLEILNYTRAMQHGLARLSELPLGRRLMCEVHRVLMENARGGEPQKTPGQFRRSQNWIGGASPATAKFVPPPPEIVDDTFSELERFLHDPTPMPALIKIGLAHAQFETIHPFLDGNGRTGRLLITFWLTEQGILRRPLLHPSLYLKVHRDDYIDRLQDIRDHGSWEEWLKFFVDGLAQAATEAADRARDIVALRERDRDRIARRLGRRSGNGLQLLDHLFRQPVVTVGIVQRFLEVSQPTASGLVNELADMGLLNEITGRQRNRIFSYEEYIRAFPGAESRQ